MRKLARLIRITECSPEAVRFDSQLFGYENREYLLEKYGHTCQYCGGASGDPVLEWEHIVPKSKSGSDKVSNATLSCSTCNEAKDSKMPEERRREEEAVATDGKGMRKRKELAKARIAGIDCVLAGKPNSVSNRYSAWVNSSCRYVERGPFGMFGGAECASGGRTKYNRTMLGLAKDHHFDALGVGSVPEGGYTDRTNGYCLYAKAMGRGNRFRGKSANAALSYRSCAVNPKSDSGFRTETLCGRKSRPVSAAGHGPGAS